MDLKSNQQQLGLTKNLRNYQEAPQAEQALPPSDNIMDLTVFPREERSQPVEDGVEDMDVTKPFPPNTSPRNLGFAWDLHIKHGVLNTNRGMGL